MLCSGLLPRRVTQLEAEAEKVTLVEAVKVSNTIEDVATGTAMGVTDEDTMTEAVKIRTG